MVVLDFEPGGDIVHAMGWIRDYAWIRLLYKLKYVRISLVGYLFCRDKVNRGIFT